MSPSRRGWLWKEQGKRAWPLVLHPGPASLPAVGAELEWGRTDTFSIPRLCPVAPDPRTHTHTCGTEPHSGLNPRITSTIRPPASRQGEPQGIKPTGPKRDGQAGLQENFLGGKCGQVSPQHHLQCQCPSRQAKFRGFTFIFFPDCLYICF